MEIFITIIVSIAVLLTMIFAWQRKKYTWVIPMVVSVIFMGVIPVKTPIDVFTPIFLLFMTLIFAFAHVEWNSKLDEISHKIHIRYLNNRYLGLILGFIALTFILIPDFYYISFVMASVGLILLMCRFIESWVLILFSLSIFLNRDIAEINYVQIQYVFMMCCAFDAFLSWKKAIQNEKTEL